VDPHFDSSSPKDAQTGLYFPVGPPNFKAAARPPLKDGSLQVPLNEYQIHLGLVAQLAASEKVLQCLNLAPARLNPGICLDRFIRETVGAVGILSAHGENRPLDLQRLDLLLLLFDRLELLDRFDLWDRLLLDLDDRFLLFDRLDDFERHFLNLPLFVRHLRDGMIIRA
jgi:hypothetical protein